MNLPGEHRWFLTHQVAFAAGLLDEEEESRVREHLAACVSCRRSSEDFDRDDETGAGVQTGASRSGESDPHIPSGILAMWDRAAPALQGLEREMVEKHLARCLDCQDDLRTFGFVPVLGSSVAPFLEPRIVATLDPAREGRRAVEIRVRPSRSRLWGWWLLGGWAGLSTAILLVTTFSPRPERAPDHPYGAVIPWVAPEAVRGERAVDVVEVAGGQHRVVLAVPVPVEARSDVPASIAVFGPDGAQILSLTVNPGDQLRRRVMVYLESPRALAPGRYRVVYRRQIGGQIVTPAVETCFELRVIQDR